MGASSSSLMHPSILNSLIVVVATFLLLSIVRLCRRWFFDTPVPAFAFVGGDAPLDNTFDPKFLVANSRSLVESKRIETVLLAIKKNKTNADFILEQHRRLGRLFVTKIGTSYYQVNVADADVARRILLTDVDSFEKMETAVAQNLATRRFLGTSNVVFSDGKEWKRMRTAINPAFYSVDRFATVFGKSIDECFSLLDAALVSRSGGTSTSMALKIDVYQLMQALTLDILGSSIFQHQFGAMRGQFSKELAAYKTVMTNLLQPLAQALPWTQYLPTAHNKKINASLEIVEKLFSRLIQRARDRMEKQQDSTTAANTCLMDILIESELTSQELRNNTAIFFFAGHDTLGLSLSYSLAMLALHPEKQALLFEAVQRDVGDNDLSPDRLKECSYLDWFIREVLRLHPPLLQLPSRLVKQDIVLNCYKVPKGSLVQIDIHAIHQDPVLWGADCACFVPERFSPERSKNRPSHAFLAFGGGRRVCLGQSFAMLEMRLFLARFIQKYVVRPAPGYDKICAGFSVLVQKRV